MFIKKNTHISVLIVVLAFLSAGAVSAQDMRNTDGVAHTQTGVASYYSSSFNGQLTSSGEVFSNANLTAASNTLPLGTFVKVTNVHNRKWVVVKINDRMNKNNKRTIDLTRFAAKKLGMLYRGITRVKVEVIPPEFYAFYHISPDELIAYDGKESGQNTGS